MNFKKFKKVIFILGILIPATGYAVDQLIRATSGNLILDATTGATVIINKTLKVNNITDSTGIAAPPGMVPIGAMLAVMPNTHANAWQPPSDCSTIKDGFMRTNSPTTPFGACVVPTCADCIIPAGTTLPSMYQKYARGSTTSGATGGSNTFTPTGTNLTSNVPATGLTFSGTSGTYSVSVPGHNHAMIAGATLSVSINHKHAAESFTSGNQSSNHTHTGTTDAGGSTDNYGSRYVRLGNNFYYGPLPASGTGTGVQEAGTHTHSFTSGNQSAGHTHTTSVDLANFVGSSTPTGTIGLVPGQDGNGSITASGSNTPVGSIGGTAIAAAQTFVGIATNSQPSYVEVVWVIRVK